MGVDLEAKGWDKHEVKKMKSGGRMICENVTDRVFIGRKSASAAEMFRKRSFGRKKESVGNVPENRDAGFQERA